MNNNGISIQDLDPEFLVKIGALNPENRKIEPRLKVLADVIKQISGLNIREAKWVLNQAFKLIEGQRSREKSNVYHINERKGVKYGHNRLFRMWSKYVAFRNH